MNILITGIYGQDGVILSKIYKKKKVNVFGFVRKIKRNNTTNLNKDIKLFENNLSNFFKILKNLKKIKPDIIIHLAANNVDAGKNKKFIKHYLVNYFQFLNIFFASIIFNNKTKFIFAGSSMMFDKSKETTIDDKSKFSPINYYGKYKIHSHIIMMLFKKIFNLKCTTLILFNHDSKYRNVNFLFPRLIKSHISGKKKLLKKIINLNLHNDYLHAYDVCATIYKISLSKLNEDKIVIASGYLTSVNKILKKVLKIKIKNTSKINNKNLIGSNIYLKKNYNFKPKSNIFNAVKELYNYTKFFK